MVAYLFAAGNGMRLRPLTNDIQKCLLPVGGKPMLEWWLEASFDSECFDKIFVNVHYMADQVKEWIEEYSDRKQRYIRVIDESPMLLGTAGTLFKHGDKTQDFMIAYTDTFSMDFYCRLPRIVDEWERLSKIITAGLVTFTPPGDGSTGNLIVDSNELVTSFKEKAIGSKGLAWAGMMFARKGFYNFINRDDKDIAKDVLPRLVGRMMAIEHVKAYDIGRGVEYYEQFNRDFDKQAI